MEKEFFLRHLEYMEKSMEAETSLSAQYIKYNTLLHKHHFDTQFKSLAERKRERIDNIKRGDIRVNYITENTLNL